MKYENYDFSGYATKNDVTCLDGRIIRKDAFIEQDDAKVTLVWQHDHNSPENVLGHGFLENREDGVYVYGYFNETEAGQTAKQLVHGKDIDSLSIFANELIQRGKEVIHGVIREVSLVISGANPEALIDNVVLAHSADGDTIDTKSAIIYSGDYLDGYENNDNPTEDNEIEHSGTDEDPKKDNETDETIEHSAIDIEAILNDFSDDQKLAVNMLIDEMIEELDTIQHGATEDMSIAEIFDTLSDVQKDAVYVMMAQLMGDDEVKHNATDNDENTLAHSSEGGNEMKNNIFMQTKDGKVDKRPILSHAAIAQIFEEARTKKADSLKDLFLAHAADAISNSAELKHAGTYGIDDIDILFPDANVLNNEPDFISRRMEWVDDVLKATHHSPFSRVKTVHADITGPEARARGYVKGNQKVEEVIKLLKRVTTPTTIYKKQKLDRDDILDITDLNVVAWLKAEMRIMLDEEIARAILIGDGRSSASEDKISEENIRPVASDDDLYAHKVVIASDRTVDKIMEDIIRARKYYKGSGRPVLYTTTDFVTDMLLLKDEMGRRLYKSVKEVAEDLRVSKIVEVEVMEGQEVEVEEYTKNLLGVIVNLMDYNVGADKGGQVSMFDDFDIDFNQFKYLIETRISGALTKPKSALVIAQTKAA